MNKDREIKINARGLANPGPRMMVDSTLAERDCDTMRVVVSSAEALEDLRTYFESIGTSIETDHIGDDYHIFVDFTSQNKS